MFLSKWVPIHKVKYCHNISPWKPERETTPRSQTSSSFGLCGMNMAKWSLWINQKTRLQQKNFKIPHGVLGRLELKTHSTLLVMISRARRASENPSLPLPVPLGAVVAQLRLLLAIGSACWAVSHRQPQAPSAEGFGCKPASAAEGNWKTIKARHIWHGKMYVLWELHWCRTCGTASQPSSPF